MATKSKRRRRNPLAYAIYAKKGRNGQELSFNGAKFTNNSKPRFFASKETAYKAARSLVDHNARVLHGYQVTIKIARGKPIKGTSRGFLPVSQWSY